MNIPRQTADIFDMLSKGQFICSNSVDDSIRKLYNVVEEHFEDLTAYFSAIGFVLERGAEYFYFSRTENRADLERKIEQAYRWIDIMDFCKAFNNSFGPGFRFAPSDILVQVKMDASLKDKLATIKKSGGEVSNQERVDRIINDLEKFGMLELENEINQTYKVTAAFKYLEQLIVSIHIAEEVQYEIPQ
ncbi:MAG: hypothetical protein ABIX01_21040 [Chitinophagaceae bacterium]